MRLAGVNVYNLQKRKKYNIPSRFWYMECSNMKIERLLVGSEYCY
jgi:hypothetical protein